MNSTYTGVLVGTATLQFYPPVPGVQQASVPDAVYYMSAGPTGGAVTLSTPADQLAATITFPTNVQRAYIDVLTQGQQSDEFWYTCVPSALASELDSCASTSFREAEISIDGQPAGAAPVYPWIFTGGIDPFLWEPTPGVQTLDLLPYRVDISPFAGLLSNGQPHTLAISVYNADSYFLASGVVFVYRYAEAAAVTGAITQNTLTAAPAPVIDNQLVTGAQGDVSGTITTTSARRFNIAGYIDTPQGRIDMSVSQTMTYLNNQVFLINASDFVQDITQHTQVATETIVSGAGNRSQESRQVSYPLTVDIVYGAAANGASTQKTTIDQSYSSSLSLETNGAPLYASQVHNEVTPGDALHFAASGNFTGNSGQQSRQTFDFSDSLGSCYERTVSSAAGLLTAVTDGQGCSNGRNAVPWFVDPYGYLLPDLR